MKYIDMSAASRLGCVRDNNEDMVLASGMLVRDGAMSTRLYLTGTERLVVAVADGMGGHNAGEVASEETLSNLRYFVSDLPAGLPPEELGSLLDGWLSSMNKILASKGSVNPEHYNMGTTLVAVICYGGRFFWINCGDSRLYRWRSGVLAIMSEDHVQPCTAAGADASGMITNCIGAGCTTSYIDKREFTADVKPGDVYVLCSDGLSDMLTDAVIESVVASGGDADALCSSAIAAGGYDNVSVCMMKIV